MKKTAKIVLACTLLSGSLLAVSSQTYAAPVFTTKVDHQQQHEKTLLQTRDLAKQGKVINSETFGLKTSKQEIVKKWGQPEESDSSSDGYLDYQKRGIKFLLSSNQVDMLVSSDKNLTSITYKEVQKVLGKGSSDESDGKGDTFGVQYQAGKHLLTFIFPKKSNQNSNNPKILNVIVN